ncbi:MAG: CoA pyrophosphatase [Pseudomonadota bacterium]
MLVEGQSAYSLEFVRSRVQSLRPLLDDRLDGDFHLNEDLRKDIVEHAKKPAAVLIGLVEREEEAHVLLTKRTEALRSHSGQIAFPGGKIDDDDASPEAAALREAQEEIGLDPTEVDILARLPDYHSGSGFKIHPVLAAVKPDADFEINPGEVEYMFDVPLSFLMNPANHQTASKFFKGAERHYYEMPYGEHYIWGVTAGIIRVLYDRVFSHAAT